MATVNPAWRTAASVPVARAISSIAIHCSATIDGRDHRAADIRAWHKAQGWRDIGYHFVIDLDGAIEVGRPLATAGSHVLGHNSHSIGIVYIGGLGKDAKAKDTRTTGQKAALVALLRVLKGRWPRAVVQGHRDYSPDRDGDGVIEPHEWMKACPCFDAKAEYAKL